MDFNLDPQHLKLGRSLLAGVLTEQVKDRGKVHQFLVAGVAVLAVVGTVLTSGALRWLLVVVALVAAAVAIVVVVVRRAALFAIARFAPAAALDDTRALIATAIDDADIPTGPLSALQFLRRLRKGRAAELDRLKGILSRLEAGLRESSAGDP